MKHEKLPVIVAPMNREMPFGASIGRISFRPPGYPQSLLIGFVIGCLAFLVGNAGAGGENAAADLRMLTACAGGGAALALAVNFIAERRIRAKHEAQKTLFARYMFGPARSCPR